MTQLHSKVFTTGDVAKMLTVAPRTVSKWFDSGLLKGYRIPLSNDRRIPRASLVRFLIDQKMPIPPELQTGRAVVASATPALVEAAIDASIVHRVAVTVIADWFSLGVEMRDPEHPPRLVVIDLALGTAAGLSVAAGLADHFQVLVCHWEERPAIPEGVDAVELPAGIPLVVERVRELIEEG
jgi:hypothetical protein